MKNITLYNPDPSNYVNNIQGHKGKANIHFEFEPTNQYDSEAIMVFTFRQNGEREDLGYIQKKRFTGYEWSQDFLEKYSEWEDRANEGLYEDGPSILEEWMTYVPGKTWYYHNEWSGGYNMPKTYEYLYEEGELEKALEEIAKGNMRYQYRYEDDYRFLFDKTLV
jgi:hypothetical protein